MLEYLRVLQHVAADGELRKQLEIENYNTIELEGIFGKQNAKIEEQEEMLKEKDVALSQKDAELEKERKEKAQKDIALSQQAAEIEELKRLLSQKKE